MSDRKSWELGEPPDGDETDSSRGDGTEPLLVARPLRPGAGSEEQGAAGGAPGVPSAPPDRPILMGNPKGSRYTNVPPGPPPERPILMGNPKGSSYGSWGSSGGSLSARTRVLAIVIGIALGVAGMALYRFFHG
jgi:hypothetical protein